MNGAPSLSRTALRNKGSICALCQVALPPITRGMGCDSSTELAAKSGTFLCRSGGMADTASLKFAALGREGSIPSFGTI